MHADKIKRGWRSLHNKLKSFWDSLGDYVPSNAKPARIIIGASILALLSANSLASAKNEDRQERKAERQAEHAQQKSNNQAARAGRQDNRQANRDDRANGRENDRQENKQVQAQNRAAQQAQFRANSDADQARANNQAQKQAVRKAQNQAADQANRDQANRNQWKKNQAANNRANDRALTQAANDRRDRDERRDDRRAQNRNDVRAQDRAFNDRRNDTRTQNHSKYRWDNGLDNRKRYQTYRKYRNNWGDQRSYLNANLKRFNQLAALNQAQQQQLDNQMQDAYRAYHNNQWNGGYSWDNYSDPKFLDYLQNNKPSLLQNILSALGLGGNDDYLYSQNWNDERSQLSTNMANIHRLALEGRITSRQEQDLINQMRPEFMAYQDNNWNGGNPNWTQYSEPGFVDYLNKRQPSILTTVRDYLIR